VRVLRRLLAVVVLGLWLDGDEREDVLADLEALADGVVRRRGKLAGALWLGRELLRYPRFLLGTRSPDRRPPSPARPARRPGLERWRRELRYAVRRVRRRPGASAVIILTLGMGIGASTSVFSVLSTLVLRPLPFDEPDRLVRVRENLVVQSGPPREVTMSPRRFEILRDRAKSFVDVAAARYRTFTLGGEGEPERVVGLTATWSHFTVLGVGAARGRTFTPEEDAPGAPAPVAVISESLWTRRFGRAPTAVGAELVIDGRPHTVIGVMPRGFRYPYAGEVWIPMGIDPAGQDYEAARGLNVSGRLAPGSTMASAREELDGLSRALARERPDTDDRIGYTFKTLEEEILEGVPRKVAALLGAALFVLLIGAGNVASMIAARLHVEERELSLQVALGAGQGDLIRRVVSESLVLGFSSLALGLGLSAGTVGYLTSLSPVSDLGPYFQDFGVDLRVAFFGGVLAVGAVALASIPSLFLLRRRGSAASLRRVGHGPRRMGMGFLDLVVTAELAVAVVLLTGAGLTLQSVRAEWGIDTGLRPEGLHTFSVAPTSSGYAEAEARVAYLDQVLANVRAVAGVEAAGYTNLNPIRSQGWGTSVLADGESDAVPGALYQINHRAVSEGYFEVAGTGITAGRGFGPSDGPSDPAVAVVSRALADALWRGEDPLGKRLRVGTSDGEIVTVVGVAEDVKELDFLEETWYRPYAQTPGDYNTLVVEIFVRSGSRSFLPGVREAIRAVDDGVPVFRIQTMEEILRFERRVEAFGTLLLALFAGMGLLMAGVGIYGVLSYVTGRRTREIGLRVALGARRWDVMREVTVRTLGTCAVGLAVGCLGAAGMARMMESLVVDVRAFSPLVYGSTALVVLAMALAASAPPTMRALRIHPREALGQE
jgi:putative ABC transport system permease protein